MIAAPTTAYMGKFYLIPESEQTKGESIIYLNFGWIYKGEIHQRFPPYSKTILKNVCSESQYENLCNEITTYLKKNGYNLCLANCGYVCYWIGCLPLIFSCVYSAVYADKVRNTLKQIVSNNTMDWSNCTVSLEFMPQRDPSLVRDLRNGLGYFEDGTVLTRPEIIGRGSDSHPTGRYEAVWPPSGCNIVLTIKDMSIREEWPKLGVNEVPVRSVVMDREINIADELEKLVKLNKDGYLTDSEFITAKAKVLNQA